MVQNEINEQEEFLEEVQISLQDDVATISSKETGDKLFRILYADREKIQKFIDTEIDSEKFNQHYKPVGLYKKSFRMELLNAILRSLSSPKEKDNVMESIKG